MKGKWVSRNVIELSGKGYVNGPDQRFHLANSIKQESKQSKVAEHNTQMKKTIKSTNRTKEACFKNKAQFKQNHSNIENLIFILLRNPGNEATFRNQLVSNQNDL